MFEAKGHVLQDVVVVWRATRLVEDLETVYISYPQDGANGCGGEVD
jgi:hypothetical protein